MKRVLALAAFLSAVFLCAPLLASLAANAAALQQPYGAPEHQWAKTSGDWSWGGSAGIERGPHGQIWAIDRCGANSCDGSDRAPIVELDTKTGKPIRAIGAGLFVFPHGLAVDPKGNIWVTDGAVSKDGTKGLQVIELSPAGKVLMRLGTAGQRGGDASHFWSPTDVLVAPDGNIFVADGHAAIKPFIPAGSVARIMKFSPTGKLLQQWGKPGTGPGEFANPHALAMDAKGRLYVADRANDRIQIFTQDGKFLAAWKQFGRPSGLYIHGDRLYAIDADSTQATHPGWQKGVWIGSIAKALPDGFVPDPQAGEGVVVAPNGNMYGAVNVAPHGITRYLKR